MWITMSLVVIMQWVNARGVSWTAIFCGRVKLSSNNKRLNSQHRILTWKPTNKQNRVFHHYFTEGRTFILQNIERVINFFKLGDHSLKLEVGRGKKRKWHLGMSLTHNYFIFPCPFFFFFLCISGLLKTSSHFSVGECLQSTDKTPLSFTAHL